MSTEAPLLLALDLTGTFAFAVNGALTALRRRGWTSWAWSRWPCSPRSAAGSSATS